MADHQESIQDLQEKSEVLLSYFTPQTSIGMQIRHREEKISADWNILVDLLEVLTADVRSDPFRLSVDLTSLVVSPNLILNGFRSIYRLTRETSCVHQRFANLSDTLTTLTRRSLHRVQKRLSPKRRSLGRRKRTKGCWTTVTP